MLKDWKRVDKITWEHKKKKERIKLYKTNSLTNKYEVRLYKPGKIKILINFASRNEAFKEIKNYIRKH